MKIDEFVKESIVSVFKGVTEANKEYITYAGGKGVFKLGGPNRGSSRLEFNINVSAEGGGSGEINVVGIKVGAAGKDSNTSSLKFTVYMDDLNIDGWLQRNILDQKDAEIKVKTGVTAL